MTFVFAACFAFSALFSGSPCWGADAVSSVIAKYDFKPGMNLQGSGAVVEMQEDNQPAVVFGKNKKPQSMLFFWLKKSEFEGKTFKFSIEAKGQDLSKNIVFGLQGSRGGKLAWPGGAGARGTFDWKKISFTADFSTLGMDSAAVRIGLQNTSGTLWVKSLAIEDITPVKQTGAGDEYVPFSERHGSVNFAPNKFHVPDYSASRNLIQNPSFEAGTDHWVPGGWGALEKRPEDGKPLLQIDTTTAAEGKASLCQRVMEGKGGWPPATFAIPLRQGEEYTLSFYAKTDNPANASLTVGGITDVWDTFLPKRRYKLSPHWKRHIYHFKSPKKMASIFFGTTHTERYKPFRIWLDAVQLEKGKKATAFTRLPLAVSLKTNAADNLSQPGEKANARLVVSTSMPSTGSVSYVVRDFFSAVVDRGTHSFTTTEAYVPVELPIPTCDELDSGVYTMEATASLPYGSAHTTWHRLVRMHSATEPFKHRELFCFPEERGRGNWNAALKQARKIGFGSSEFSHLPSADYLQLLEKHGFVWSCDIFRYQGWPGKIAGKYRLGSPNLGLSNPIRDEDIPQIARDIVEHSLQTIRKHPESVGFETVNEPFCQTEDDIATIVKILRELRAAARKTNPKARIMTPDCANIDHTMKYLETFFEKGGAEACDIVAWHTYRGHPDALDGDMARVIALVDKYKPGVDIWSTEGGYYNTYIIPDIGFSRVTHGGDHYRAGNMSYDLGLGEKIALAYQTRFRVQALKYANRLKRDADWNDVSDHRTCFGIDMIPAAGVFATNTPARFLGNADFAADLKLPKSIRGYLFKDTAARPVAVLWYTNDSETLYKNANPATMVPDKTGESFEAFSVVGAAINYDKEIALTGYPVFLRGKPGQEDAFKKTIETANYVLPEVGEQLKQTFDLKEDGRFIAKFRNRFNKKLKGELVCKINGREACRTTLDMEPYGTFEKPFEFPASKPSLNSVHYSYRFTGADGKELAKDLDIKYFTAPKVAKDTFDMSGNWGKWDGMGKISTDNTDPPEANKRFAADTCWAWNKDYLYCLLDVKDQKFEPSKTIQFPTRGDCVELFFDAYADSVKYEHHKTEGYAEDDQYYTMWFAKDGKADAFRTQEAHWQLSFNKPGRAGGIESNYEQTSKGYRLQIAFPMREIKPVELAEGACFGMNALIRDNGVGKTLFGSGETPCHWRAPRNYVFVFLGR